MELGGLGDQEHRAYVAAALAAMSCGSLPPGELEPSELSVRDSAGIWVAVIEAMLAESEAPRESGRVWLPATLVEDGVAPYREGAPPLPTTVRERIRGALPGARFVENWPNLFERVFKCPPGVEVAMPGRGCPIREDGVVVMLGPLRIDESGDLMSRSSLVQSRQDREGAYTWQRGFRVRIEPTGSGEWAVIEIVLVSVT